MDKHSQTNKCDTIGRSKISYVLFTDDLVLLAFESGLQFALNGFAAAYDIARMKINTSIAKVLYLSKNPARYSLQVSRALLKQFEKYFGVAFTSDRRQDKRIGCSIRKSKRW